MADQTIEVVELLQNELVIANDRAMRAEKKLLELQIESFIGNLRDSQRLIEDSFTKKQRAYGGATEELSKNEKEFKEKIDDIKKDIKAKEEIYELYRRAVDNGLHLDDLPHLTIDKTTYEVHLLLQKKLIEKKKKEDKKDHAWKALRNLFINGGNEERDCGGETREEVTNGNCDDKLFGKQQRDGDAYDLKKGIQDTGSIKEKLPTRDETVLRQQKLVSPESADLEKSPAIHGGSKNITKPGETEISERINYISSYEKEEKTANGKGGDYVEAPDWTKEPFLTVVKQLKSQHKQLSLKGAQETLEKSAREIGSVKDLDVVYNHAKERVAMMFKPEKKEPAHKLNTVKALTLGQQVPAQNKKRLCEFYMNGYCGFGSSCRFLHGDDSSRVNHNGHNNQHQQGHVEKTKSRMCHFFLSNNWCGFGDNCKFAHSPDELSKAGGGSQGNKTGADKFNHPEPCDDQECPKKLKYLLRKTSMCPQVSEGQPCRLGEKGCSYAHDPREIRSMPKWEMCERAMSSCCKHQREPRKCVYAHSRAELKPRPDEELPAEDIACAICQRPLQAGERTPLTCGHDTFHQQCIHGWLASLPDPYCPICVKG